MNSSGWDSRFAANPHHFGAGPNTLLEKHVADLAPGTAADVGCGQGRNTAWLASRGWHVTAVDYSTVGLEHTREATAAALGAAAESVGATETAGAASPAAVDDLLTTVHSDVMEWEPGTTFDLVVAAYLHMPSSDMRVLWRRLADATAPGGTLVVVGHDTDNAGGGPKDPDVLFHAEDVTAELPDGWEVTVAEAVDRGEGSVDALMVARKSR
ncbi:bifunctional 2-polyprenyl-6-hydroxyphenol methylase/3-demethylubiquinol 3-O-methyltransferase UbiG [uncultured Corynebacterium sp.]|uniref:class I SAM-dependent methyltransferase n=1 Tax=uncultured Corynebacterium sp. TaxID=159447 RepID=UPI00261B7CE4|nr:class I SAM-dependent methyltransferase [uncultured Corynebacterium sp.]